MNVLLKILQIIIKVLLPKKISEYILIRSKKTKDIFTSSKELRLFFYIMFLPFDIFFSFFFALCKIILLWCVPITLYGHFKYIAKQFYNDIVVLQNVSLSSAFKRSRLLLELFTKGAERRVSFGDKNPNIVFYVIRPYYFLKPNELILENVANLLTQYYYVLQKLSYAIEKGYIPIIDWEHYGKMPHSEDYPINGTNNSWEYYWQQPSVYNLSEIYQSKNVILSTQNIGQFGYIPNCAMRPPFNKYAKDIMRLCPKYAKYIPLNKNTLDYIQNKYNELFPLSGRVLGVVIRGSSYGVNRTQFSSHPTQLSIEELIEQVHKCLNEWNYEYVFFMNEVQEIVDIMKKEFGSKLIILPRMRDTLSRRTDGSELNPMYFDGQRFQTNLDYITEVALLSKCDSLIGSMSSGTRTALILNNNNYEHVYIFERGLW